MLNRNFFSRVFKMTAAIGLLGILTVAFQNAAIPGCPTGYGELPGTGQCIPPSSVCPAGSTATVAGCKSSSVCGYSNIFYPTPLYAYTCPAPYSGTASCNIVSSCNAPNVCATGWTYDNNVHRCTIAGSFGEVTSVSPEGLLVGWARNPLYPNLALQVTVYVRRLLPNGSYSIQDFYAVANDPTPTGNNGFHVQLDDTFRDGLTYEILPPSAGTSTPVNAYGQLQGLTSFSLPAVKRPSFAPIVNGNLVEAISAGGLVTGFAQNFSSPVSFYLDGSMTGSPSAQLLGTVYSMVNRTDGRNGFAFSLPPALNDGRIHSLYIYSYNSLVGGSPITFIYGKATNSAEIALSPTPTPGLHVPLPSPTPGWPNWIKITSPVSDVVAQNPVLFQATASCSVAPAKITVSIDATVRTDGVIIGGTVFSVPGSTVSKSVSLSANYHKVYFEAFDSTGKRCAQASVNEFYVGSAPAPGPFPSATPIPSPSLMPLGNTESGLNYICPLIASVGSSDPSFYGSTCRGQFAQYPTCNWYKNKVAQTAQCTAVYGVTKLYSCPSIPSGACADASLCQSSCIGQLQPGSSCTWYSANGAANTAACTNLVGAPTVPLFSCDSSSTRSPGCKDASCMGSCWGQRSSNPTCTSFLNGAPVTQTCIYNWNQIF